MTFPQRYFWVSRHVNWYTFTDSTDNSSCIFRVKHSQSTLVRFYPEDKGNTKFRNVSCYQLTLGNVPQSSILIIQILSS